MDEELGMEAMGMMTGGPDEMGVTNVPVPNFALPAVLELISMLEEEMSGSSMGGEMGGEMPPMPPPPSEPMM